MTPHDLWDNPDTEGPWHVDEFRDRVLLDTLDQPADRLLERFVFGAAIGEIPPPRPLMAELLMQDSLAMLYGASGSGKSFVALDWAACVATGTPWFGRLIESAAVLYVVAEGVSGIGQRLAAWAAHRGRRLEELDQLAFLPGRCDLSSPGEVAVLSRAARRLGTRLVVFDTLARNTPAADENSGRDMGRVVEHLDGLRRGLDGATVLVVHHSGKDIDRGARGHSSLRAAMDTEIELKGAEGILPLKVTKQKDGPEVGPFRYRLAEGHGSMVLDSYVGRAEDVNARKVLAVLASIDVDGTSSTAWIESSEALGLARSSFHAAKKICVERGWVSKTSPDARYSPYTLTDLGRRSIESESKGVQP